MAVVGLHQSGKVQLFALKVELNSLSTNFRRDALQRSCRSYRIPLPLIVSSAADNCAADFSLTI